MHFFREFGWSLLIVSMRYNAKKLAFTFVDHIICDRNCQYYAMLLP